MEKLEKKPVKSKDVISELYKTINESNAGGQFRKTVFHVHTPESHDFKLINEETMELLGIKREKEIKSWREFTSSELLKIAKHYDLILNDEYEISDFKKLLEVDTYTNADEFLSFLILGHCILKQGIELVLVCDHNTLLGHAKLQKAIRILRRERPDYEVRTRVELGIEISCSDKNHVVGILNQGNQSQISAMRKWMRENIISPADGTIRMTYDVFEHFGQIGAIGYIAHINSSDIFKADFLTRTYKTQLFNSSLFSIIGVTDTNQIEATKNRIRGITKRPFNYVIDNDAHTVEELNEKFFYVKGDIMDFNAIDAALKDFDLSVSYEHVKNPSKFIKALYVEGREFLRGKDQDSMILKFSPNFNSIIGGRGSGKSTILNIIGYVTSQVVDSRSKLSKILNQGTCCVVYHHEGEDYYIFFFSSFKESNKEFLGNLFGYRNDHSQFDRQENPEVYEKVLRKTSISDRVQVFTFDGKIVTELTKTKQVLDKLYTRKFTINELVNIAGNQSYMTKFIQSTIYDYKKIKKVRGISSFKDGFQGIFEKYMTIPDILEKRKKNIEQILLDYNCQQEDKLKVIFSHKSMNDTHFEWISTLGVNHYANQRFFKRYAIKHQNLSSYLNKLTIELGDPFKVLELFWNKEFAILEKAANLNTYFENRTQKIIESNLKFVDNVDNRISFFEEVRDVLFEETGLNYMRNFLKNYVKESDCFELEFNINNREHINTSGKNFRNITDLSMGQKVVAILSFVLTFSEFTKDDAPFIVDQPEDNLDNPYIYKNLVKDLRQLKLKRQVILASHNSTIVMNSGSEQVIVMESDNDKGWPAVNGYMADKKIVRQVVNILEGGNAAFIDKVYLYSAILRKNVSTEWNDPTRKIYESNSLVEQIVEVLEEKTGNANISQLEKILKVISNIDPNTEN